MIIKAHIEGHLCSVIDKIDLNLPPGTISKAAKKMNCSGQVEQQVLQQICERLQTNIGFAANENQTGTAGEDQIDKQVLYNQYAAACQSAKFEDISPDGKQEEQGEENYEPAHQE